MDLICQLNIVMSHRSHILHLIPWHRNLPYHLSHQSSSFHQWNHTWFVWNLSSYIQPPIRPHCIIPNVYVRPNNIPIYHWQSMRHIRVPPSPTSMYARDNRGWILLLPWWQWRRRPRLWLVECQVHSAVWYCRCHGTIESRQIHRLTQWCDSCLY